MFTTRNFPIIAAATVAGLIGTVGIVAASASDNADELPVAASAESAAVAEVPAEASVNTSSDTPGLAPATPLPSPTPTTAPAPEPSPTTATPAATSSEPTNVPGPATPQAAATEIIETGQLDPDPEPPAPGEPGVESGEGEPDDPPPPPPIGGPTDLASVPKPTPPLPPVPGPIDLVTPPMDPGPTPFDGPTDFQVAPLPAYLGDITSGLTGCQLECVQSALLSANPANANLQLDVETTVPVHFEVEVTETDGTWGKHFNNPGYDTEWSTTLGQLQPDTTYDLTMIAIDADGHSKVYEHQFTTVAIIDGFASNAHGCELECLTVGTITKTDKASKVEVHIKSNSPAALRVWFSTSEPTWVDNPDAKPNYGPVFENDNPSTSWTFDVNNLTPDTTYHVVAKAHDGYGEHYQVGSFRTDIEPTKNVLVTFEQIIVSHDGDDGALNRGELAFSWGFDGVGIGHRSEQKMHAGTVNVSSNNSKWFSVAIDGGTIPELTVGAHERDADGLVEFCTAGLGPGVNPHYNADCDTKTNVARMGGPLTLTEIEAFPECAGYGIDAGPGARCAAIGSSVFGTRDMDYAHFTTIVSFVITD